MAAAAISLSIIRDGFGDLREVITHLGDEIPKTTDHSQFDPLPKDFVERIKQLSWVADAQVRLPKEGRVYFGEVFVVASDSTDLIAKLEEATRHCTELAWRIHDIVVVPIRSL